MASTSTARPFLRLQPPSPSSPSSSSSSDSSSHSADTLFLYHQSRPPVSSHYRPFSVHYSPSTSPDLSYTPPPRPRRSSARPLSSCGIPALASMAFGFKDKDNTRARKTSDVHVTRSGSPTRRPLTPVDNSERPSTHTGRFMAATLHRAKKKKSLASFLNLSSDTPKVSPHASAHPEPSHHSSPLNSPAPLPYCESPIEGPSERDSALPILIVAPAESEEEEEYDYGQVVRYVPKSTWLRKYDTKLHPYPLEAPYMQAYDSILLDNDRHTDFLLRRLNPSGSPTFHDYGKTPPSTALDIGCGQGHWVMQAANAWRPNGTIVTGLDLVDVTLPTLEEFENVKFIRGNFLKYPLPFPDTTFDLVRMANLSLCIPYDKWEYVLSEARRVLTPGGRLELIDDQIFFPYGDAPKIPILTEPVAAGPTLPISRSSFDFDDDSEDDEDVLEDQDEEEIPDTPSSPLGDSDLSSLSPQQAPTSSLNLKQSPPAPTRGLPDPPNTTPEYSSTCDDPTWEQQATASKDLETVFETMLNKTLGIHPRPSEFILDLMKLVFGRENANKLRTMHLKLAPRDTGSGTGSAGSSLEGSDKESDRASMKSSDILGNGSGKKSWMSIEWDKKDKKATSMREASDDAAASPVERSSGESFMTSSQVPERISAKAAGRLGITYTALAAATAASIRAPSQSSLPLPSPQQSPSNSTQSPGLILLPSTFIPMSASELEMHVCKHLHVLLGCKAALANYIKGFTDEHGERLVGDKDFREAIWEYECFRRHRFNWPSDVPEARLEPDPPSDFTPKSATLRGSTSSTFDLSSLSHSRSSTELSNPYTTDELTHVRTLRVYSAVKSDDGLLEF